jgi:hypothetical protein
VALEAAVLAQVDAVLVDGVGDHRRLLFPGHVEAAGHRQRRLVQHGVGVVGHGVAAQRRHLLGGAEVRGSSGGADQQGAIGRFIGLSPPSVLAECLSCPVVVGGYGISPKSTVIARTHGSPSVTQAGALRRGC